MKIRVWGARGSIPVPGPKTVKYGGNTSCLEVRTGSGNLIIFDAGTGIRALGEALEAEGGAIEGHIFFTHVHWDHIQGFPFFMPAYGKENTFHIYGEKKFKTSLEDTLSGQMQYPNFPVLLEELTAGMTFNHLSEFDEVKVGSARVRCIRGNHPDSVFIYRVDENGKSMVYATDNEHFTCIPPKLLDFVRGVDALIYDAQFTSDEYCGETGRCRASWGHSTIEEGVRLAEAAGVGQLILWHHDPSHDDARIAAMEKWARERLPGARAAFEGLEIDL